MQDSISATQLCTEGRQQTNGQPRSVAGGGGGAVFRREPGLTLAGITTSRLHSRGHRITCSDEPFGLGANREGETSHGERAETDTQNSSRDRRDG